MSSPVTTGDSPSERLSRKANAHYALALGLKQQGHEDAAIAAMGRADHFRDAATRARAWEPNRFTRTDG